MKSVPRLTGGDLSVRRFGGHLLNLSHSTWMEGFAMIVDRAWVERNVGFDPIARPAPDATFAVPAAATKSPDIQDLQREIIDFDSEAPAGLQFLAFTTTTGLSPLTEIPC